MTQLFIASVFLIAAGLAGALYFTRLQRVRTIAATQVQAILPPVNRYRPMLRLLSADDEALLGGNKVLTRRLKKQRIGIFREYLSCLSADYGRLLAGVRASMAASGIDRPDLASALVRNQTLFALALCRIEYRLMLHRFGLGSVDVSGLVEAISALQSQLQVFKQPAMAAAR